MHRANALQRRQAREAVAEALYRPAFLVDRNQQMVVAIGANGMAQRQQLRG